MGEKINNVMRDCTWLRALLYFLIAAIPALMVDLGQFKAFSEITDITLAIIIANFTLQGLIAVRAFMDQSLSRTKEKREKKVELLNESSK